jgi:hypothetical protein
LAIDKLDAFDDGGQPARFRSPCSPARSWASLAGEQLNKLALAITRDPGAPQAVMPSRGAAQECVRRAHDRCSARFREQAACQIARYKIKTRSTDTPIGELSGGNVQRVVLARELGGEVDSMIAANPCLPKRPSYFAPDIIAKIARFIEETGGLG